MIKRKSLWRCILILSIIQLSSSSIFSQEKPSEILISEDYMGKSIIGILKNLSIKYGLRMEYDKSDIDNKMLSVQFYKELALDEVLEKLLAGQDLHFMITSDKKVIIKPIGEELRAVYEPTQFDFSFTGKIVDFESGETLPYANVYVKSTKTGATSNIDGYFTLLNVPSDTSTLVVQYIGYLKEEFHLSPEMLEKGVKIGIQAIGTQLDEVIISDKKEHMMKASEGVSMVKVSPAQLSSLPSLGEKDIFRSLQLLPGISGTNETSSGLYVRGGTPDQNLVLLDGFTVYHVDHFYGFFSAFNANAIKDVQLYKGGFEAKYGGRLSSVVELTGKSGNTNKVSGNVGLSAVTGNASIEVPFADGDGTFLFAGRRSYTDIIQSGLYDDIFTIFNGEEEEAPQVAGPGGRGVQGRFAQQQVEPAFFFYDLNTKLSYRPSSKDIVSLSFYNGGDNLDQSNEFDSSIFGNTGGAGPVGGAQFANSTTDLTEWGNWGSSIKWGRQWNDRFFSNAVLAYSNYFSERDRFSEVERTREDSTFVTRNGTIQDNDLKDVTLRIDNEYLINEKHQLEFGTQITSSKSDFLRVLNDTTVQQDRKDKGLVSALYVQDKWKPVPGLSINPGIRLSHYDVTNKFYIEPRLSGSYQLIEKLKLKGAWGIYYQFVNRIIQEDITQGSRDFWLLSNEDTNPVGKAIHYIVGASYETNGFLFDVEAYHKDMTGLTEFTERITRRPGPPGPGGGQVSTQDSDFFQGDGYARGVEFLAQKKFGKMTGWVGYTLGEVVYDFPEISERPFKALHDQTHEFKVVNSMRLGAWTLAATYIYATGKPYTAPVGGYELTLLDGTQNSYISIGEKNALRLPSYSRVDVSATVNIPMGNSQAELGLSIFNLLNHNNIWYKTFEVEEDDVVTTDVTTIGFTPNLFLNIKF
jgi:hypothetical protein